MDRRITGLTMLLALAIHLCLGRAAAAQSLVATTVRPTAAEGGFEDSFGLTRSDADHITAALSKATTVARIRAMRQRARSGGRDVDVQLVGTEASLSQLDDLPIQHGRFLSDDDTRRRESAAVVDARIAQSLFGTTNVVGRELRVGDQYFLIVGVIKPKSTPELKRAKPRVFIPLTTMRVRYGDTLLRRDAGAFRAERYELSEIRLGFENKSAAVVSKAIVESILRKSHETKDYAVRISH